MNYRYIALILVCIAIIAAASCVGLPPGTGSKSTGSSDAAYIFTGDSATRIQPDTKPSSESSAVPVPAVTGSPSPSGAGIDTKIIKTAFVTIEVTDVPRSVDTLRAMATAKGGYLSSSSISTGYNNRRSGTVVIRIPQAEFESTLTGVKAIGSVKSVSTQGEDVTEEYVDVQAQKTSYQNQLARYHEIMKKAVNVSDVIVVQQQIDRVQTELDRLEGRLKYLNNRIDLSTITVTLQEPEPVGGNSGYSFVSTINEGIAGFFSMITALIILLFTLLPLIIIGGIGYGIYRWRKGKKGGRAPPDPAGNN